MRVIDWTSKAASFLGGVATFVIMALVAFDVLMRYFLNEPQLFVDEVVSFLQVLVVFWGLAHTFRGGGHIRVDLVTAYLPGRVRGWLRVVTLVVGIALLGVIAWVTAQSAWTAYRYGRVSAVMLYPNYRGLMGERTWGKGTVQSMIPLEGGKSLLKLTIASYWRPSGENIHHMPDATPKDRWGVTPDEGYEVPMTEQEYAAFRKYRSERDLIGSVPPAEESTAAAQSPASAFTDRPLQRAAEYLRGKVDEGKYSRPILGRFRK